jgi:hypothetical protein
MASKSIQILVNEFPATRCGQEVPNPKEYSNFNVSLRGNTRCSLAICCLFGTWNLELEISVSALLMAVLLLDLMQ